MMIGSAPLNARTQAVVQAALNINLAQGELQLANTLSNMFCLQVMAPPKLL